MRSLIIGITALFSSPSLAQQRSVVNMSGLEYNANNLAARINHEYVAPSNQTFSLAKKARFWGVRLPVSMERLQPDPKKAKAGILVEQYVSEIIDAANRGKSAGLSVIVDLHNFGQYWGNDIDRVSELESFNIRPMYLGIVRALAGRLQAAGVWAFELANEPKKLDPARCRSVMQDATIAARNGGFRGTLMVPSAWWSSAQNGINCIVNDPLGNWVQDVHAYGDNDNSGTYVRSFKAEGASHDAILNRVRTAVEQAKAKGVRVFVGEIGGPSRDPDRREQVVRAARYLAASGVDWGYWVAGEWTGNDQNSIQSGLSTNGSSAMLDALPNNR